MKRCSCCKLHKPKSEFYKNRTAKDGLYYSCKLCSTEASQRWAEKNKEKRKVYMKEYRDKSRNVVKEYKKNLCCQQCGEKHPACLVFHHKIPEDKVFNIGSGKDITGKSVEQIMNEIAKCDVLCANCHRKLHYSL